MAIDRFVAAVHPERDKEPEIATLQAESDRAIRRADSISRRLRSEALLAERRLARR